MAGRRPVIEISLKMHGRYVRPTIHRRRDGSGPQRPRTGRGPLVRWTRSRSWPEAGVESSQERTHLSSDRSHPDSRGVIELFTPQTDRPVWGPDPAGVPPSRWPQPSPARRTERARASTPPGQRSSGTPPRPIRRPAGLWFHRELVVPADGSPFSRREPRRRTPPETVDPARRIGQRDGLRRSGSMSPEHPEQLPSARPRALASIQASAGPAHLPGRDGAPQSNLVEDVLVLFRGTSRSAWWRRRPTDGRFSGGPLSTLPSIAVGCSEPPWSRPWPQDRPCPKCRRRSADRLPGGPVQPGQPVQAAG